MPIELLQVSSRLVLRDLWIFRPASAVYRNAFGYTSSVNYWYRSTKAVDFRSIPGIERVSAGLVNDTT